jgi:hypothetical protein
VHKFSSHCLVPASAALACLLLGCSQPGSPGAGPLGTLSMPLSSVVNGVHYRLSGDSFFVTGPISLELQHNGNGSSVYAALPAGAYQVELRDGWILERQTDQKYRPIEAELVSANPRPIQIESGSSLVVTWVFRTNGQSVGLEPPGVFQGNLAVLDSENPSDALAGDLLLAEQAHVDALRGIASIDGSLVIDGSGVSSLAELGSLTRIEGDLVVEGSTSLQSLDGLGQLAHIGGALRLAGNTALTSLRALAALHAVEEVSITNNPALAACEAQWLVDNVTDTLGGVIGELAPDGGLQPGGVTLSGNDPSGICD